jgi:hypothetical protein
MRVLAAGMLGTAAGWAQCAMCRTAAAQQGDAAAGAMNSAILILLVPAVAMFCGVFAMAIRAGSRNAGTDGD